MAMFLPLAAAVAVLGAQSSALPSSPYLDAVRRYGSGTEADAVQAVAALRIELARNLLVLDREQFRARYEITYEPTDRTPGWHAVDVRVPGRRGATIHARRGYQR